MSELENPESPISNLNPLPNALPQVKLHLENETHRDKLEMKEHPCSVRSDESPWAK